MALTALGIRNLKTNGKMRRIGDGRGLYLVVRANGSKAWVLRLTIDGDRTDIGLGGYPRRAAGAGAEEEPRAANGGRRGPGPTDRAATAEHPDVPRSGRAVRQGQRRPVEAGQAGRRLAAAA